ncbi:metallophosphatase family protein [Photobacterium sp. CCB-ST2H9]|uniref:metallophosphoesterase family protein n=1 Tax=Photobacterium sp. CCB-ST2H9 TaxID=2912855 RepID=UPI00200601B4|nr:metallophosphoesterase family protein [Photobacterium sp. CCB-ST2H9]UTM59038.1 metallophosphatase family protein [Photobacterium sp. CCB-ST2H9]
MEKYAILSDIHSNVFALDAVVEDAIWKGATRLVNLGDILYGPIAPRATYERLQTLNALTISGNQDRQIYQSTKDDVASNPTLQFILEDLGDVPLQWMRQLPSDVLITDDIYACHGAPDNDLMYLLEDISSGYPQVKRDDEILACLDGVQAPIILCGHTHLPRNVRLSSGQTVVNPGSVGLQAYQDEWPLPHAMQNYTPQASYVLIEEGIQGQWDISFHRVDYDVQSAVQAAKSNGREDWAHYLKTGRC